MSASELQRVVVRMMYDGAFCQRVYAELEATLHGLDLTAQERQWLVRPDPRAYGADAHRGSRALTSLLEEYPVAGALALRCECGVERLQGFFADATFHNFVQHRGSMAEAFGAYLKSDAFGPEREIGRMATVELAVAQVRRARSRPAPVDDVNPDARLCLAPWVRVLRVHPNTLTHYGDVLAHLQKRPGDLLEAVMDATYALVPAGDWLEAVDDGLLVVGGPEPEGPTLEPLSDELLALLEATREAVTLENLCVEAVRLGAEPDEAVDIIEGFVADQLMILLHAREEAPNG